MIPIFKKIIGVLLALLLLIPSLALCETTTERMIRTLIHHRTTSRNATVSVNGLVFGMALGSPSATTQRNENVTLVSLISTYTIASPFITTNDTAINANVAVSTISTSWLVASPDTSAQRNEAVEVATQFVTMSLATPNVSAQRNQSVSVSTLIDSWTLATPDTSAQRNEAVEVATQFVTMSLATPNVSAQRNQSVSVSTLIDSWTLATPAVSARRNQSVSVSTLIDSWTLATPAVSARRNQSVSVSTLIDSWTTASPVASAQRNQSVSVSTLIDSWTTASPDVASQRNEAISVVSQQLAMTFAPPSVNVGGGPSLYDNFNSNIFNTSLWSRTSATYVKDQNQRLETSGVSTWNNGVNSLTGISSTGAMELDFTVYTADTTGQYLSLKSTATFHNYGIETDTAPVGLYFSPPDSLIYIRRRLATDTAGAYTDSTVAWVPGDVYHIRLKFVPGSGFNVYIQSDQDSNYSVERMVLTTPVPATTGPWYIQAGSYTSALSYFDDVKFSTLP